MLSLGRHLYPKCIKIRAFQKQKSSCDPHLPRVAHIIWMAPKERFQKKPDQINWMLHLLHFHFRYYLFVCCGRPSLLIQRESQSHQSNANSVNKITKYKRVDLRQCCYRIFFAQLLNEWNQVSKYFATQFGRYRVYLRFRHYLVKISKIIIVHYFFYFRNVVLAGFCHHQNVVCVQN